MNCPTKEEILIAAGTSDAARKALEVLFPDVFSVELQGGQIYSWGSASDGGSGVIIERGGFIDFVNFHAGTTYLTGLPASSTSAYLNENLKKLSGHMLHNCYVGKIRGPKVFKSWQTK